MNDMNTQSRQGAVQEPVAWMHPGLGDTIKPADKRPDFTFESNGVMIPVEDFTIPLYTYPSPASHGVREALAKLVDSLDVLISNSEGVAGLHKNGDVAPWGDLTLGGPFEWWLMSLDEARASLGPDSSNTPANKKDGEG